MPEATLIDVLSADSFNEEHLPGAVNLCVYETAFIDKVREAFPDQGTALQVYGWSDSTQEAKTALSRLNEAGYQNVTILDGGLEGWKAKGGATEGASRQQVAGGRYEVDAGASFINWTGRNLFNYHTGALKLGEGFVRVEEGRLIEGEFAVDMTSLACTDLTDSAMNQMLIAHLRSDDFFKIDEHPAAKFTIASVTPIEGATAGLPNHEVKGAFTLRGATHGLTFPALIAQNENGEYVAQAVFSLDRTQWGSIYGSGKFFAKLGQHVVNDLVHLHLKVVTRRA